MAAYEVDTEDLVGIRDQLAAQAERLTATTAGVGGATTTMLGAVTTSLHEARTTIDGVLADLAATVDAATAAAAGADWLGPDAALFRDANTELAAVIARSRGRLDTALTEHGTARTQLGETLRGTLDVFTTGATRSAELSVQLGAAVGTEAESYEAAFAGGFGAAGGPGGAGPLPGQAVAGGPAAGSAPATDGTEVLDEWHGVGHLDHERRAPHLWRRQWERGSGENPADVPAAVEHTLYEDRVGAEVWRAGGTFGSDDGLHGAGRLTGLGAEAHAEATGGLNANGAFLGGAAGASAVVAAAEGQLGYGPVTANGRAFLGGEATAEAEASIGPNGVRGNLSAEAFAGARAEGEISGEAGGVTAGVGAEVSYGIGAHGEVDGSFTTDRVGVSVDVGATLGVGAGIKFDVSVDPGEVLDSVTDLFD